MSNIQYNVGYAAKSNLENAFNEIKRNHSFFNTGRGELNYQGISSPLRLFSECKSEIDDLIRHIEKEESDYNEYLQQYSHDSYAAAVTSRTSTWRYEKKAKQETNAKERIKKAIENIDSYVKHRSNELAKDFFAGLRERLSDVKTYGLGRPWGTEIRQRLAIAIGLENEVTSLWDLGLNSVANARHVYLGNHFIDLLKKDEMMKKVIAEIEEKIIDDIKRHAYKAPYLIAQKLAGRISGKSGPYGFGGQRHPDSMFTQLQTTILNPFKSFSKYSATWQTGLNDLTWSIRNASVNFNGVYHAVYNVAGFAFVWEMEFSIEDTLDLRPRSGFKIDFGGRSSGEKAYNTVTSILGTVYHDIIGNTDILKVRAVWTDHGNGKDGIYSW